VIVIRLARQSDAVALQGIEIAAGEVFRDLGMDVIADAEPPSVETIARYVDAASVWVDTDELDEPTAYVMASVVDGTGHIDQVSVHPRYAHRKVGSGLIDAVQSWAADGGLGALTLTTYRDVPWNAPYYERLGFLAMDADELGAGLVSIRRAEHRSGLDLWPRVAMARPVHLNREQREVRLRHIGAEDVDAASEHPYTLSIEQPLTSVPKIQDVLRRDGFWRRDSGALAIADARTGRLLGTTQYYRSGGGIHGYEIGYVLHRRTDWGAGRGRQALTAMSDLLFADRPACHRLQLIIETWNAASWRMAEACGYQREGTLRRAGYSSALPEDCYVYSRLRTDLIPPSRSQT
jgi:RimJ/RimL family protein N-acetyltransferase/GNAT superfamily N-acetyltransferase